MVVTGISVGDTGGADSGYHSVRISGTDIITGPGHDGDRQVAYQPINQRLLRGIAVLIARAAR